MSTFKLSTCFSAFALAALAAPYASAAAGKADGNLGARALTIELNAGSKNPVLSGDGRMAVRSSVGKVTTATRDFDLGVLSVADFGDEPAPVDHR